MRVLIAPLAVTVFLLIAAQASDASSTVPGRLDRPDLAARPGNGDDDDDDDAPPMIRAAAANLDASPPVLLLAGAAFCDEPRVQRGTADGAVDDLLVFSADDRFVQADLVSTEPGTFRFDLICPAGADSIDVTLGAVGPPGPPGEDGIPAGQSCPPGTVAIGFDLEGTLQCSVRSPATGTCPCFSDDELTELRQVIEDTIAEDPDESVLFCQIANDSILIDFGRYPASGADPSEVDLFARADTCGTRTWLPDEGIVEQYISPIAPDEARKCSAGILATAKSLGCLGGAED